MPKILIAYDGSDGSVHALKQGAKFAHLMSADVLLLAVVDLSQNFLLAEAAVDLPVEHQKRAYVEALGTARDKLQRLGIEPETRLEFGNPAETISQLARHVKAELVVIGHGSHNSLARWWGNSVESNVLQNPPSSVLIAVG